MYKKNIVFAAITTAILMGSTYAGADTLNCKNSMYGCVNNNDYASAQINSSQMYASNNYAYYYGKKYYGSGYNSKPKYFQKNGKLYMEKDGKLYVYVSRGVMPSDPFGSRASFAKNGPTSSKGTFIFDPKKLSWAAYDPSGTLVRSGPASGGSGYCPDIGKSCRTPMGRFAVYMKGPASCKSSKYPIYNPGAPMPYCMFFNGGYAIHGSYDVPNYNASHGCIRVHPTAAQWLSNNFIVRGTKVLVNPY